MTTQPLIVANLQIRRDVAGRYCLNDLHQAAGSEKRHQPANWLRLHQTIELIEAMGSDVSPVEVTQGGFDQGTYVAKELVYAYAMWISAHFHLAVIRAYDDLVTGGGGLQSDRSAAKHMARHVVVSRLYRAHTQAEREALYAHAVQLSAELGLPAPEMPGKVPEGFQGPLAAFWKAVDALTAAGARLNHARAEGVVALNLREVLGQANAAGIVMPEKRMHDALRACPRFRTANHAVSSAVTGKTVKCWIFAA